jgi:hypothetical protein
VDPDQPIVKMETLNNVIEDFHLAAALFGVGV